MDRRCLALEDDLTHLVSPLTEASVLRTLHGRFKTDRYQTSLGPVVLSVNPYLTLPGPMVLCDGCTLTVSPELVKMVRETLSEHTDTRHSQTILVSGESGSGKTYCAMQVLHQLFTLAGGGTETDTFKHLSAAMTVLHALSTASTVSNPDSTRVGFLIENYISHGAIYRTQIQCYFIELRRTTNVPAQEKNYHIFYQMLAGLTPNEKVKYHLSDYTVPDLCYLSNHGYCDLEQNKALDKLRFQCWKMSVGMLGMQFSDVIRLLAAVLLLGNVMFVQDGCQELEVKGHKEFQAVAALLGIPGVVLYKGLTTRTRTIRGQICKSRANAATANCTRDMLAQSLYSRALSCLVKTANHRSYTTSESNHSMESLDSALPDLYTNLSMRNSDVFSKNSTSDGFIGVLDMFGFEVSQVNQLDQLCMNICAEKLQNVYNTYVFKSPMETCLEEGIRPNVDVVYRDNSALIELLALQDFGVLFILDTECRLAHTSPEVLVNRIKTQCRNSDRLQAASKVYMFGIYHYAGEKVTYDARYLLQNNRDYLPDDVVCMFDPHCCNFGFASRLYSKELSIYHAACPGPSGIVHRISPGVNTDITRLDIPGTPASDFCYRLNQLLEIIYHTQPHFIRCIKSNDKMEINLFDNCSVLRQMRSLQVLETVKLMSGGLPHKLGYKQFNSQYRLFLGGTSQPSPNSLLAECKLILKCFLEEIDRSKLPYISIQWSLGRKHIFFSEGCRQQLSSVRREKMSRCAALIQAVWRGYRYRSKQPSTCKYTLTDKQNKNIRLCSGSASAGEPHREFPHYIQDTCKALGLQMTTPPPIPGNRTYTVHGDVKMYYPQVRIVNQTYHDPVSGHMFYEGDEVRVEGVSDRSGDLVVNYRASHTHLPYHLLQIKDDPAPYIFQLDV